MSLNEILSSALSGLGAAQAGIRTVSNNIANVNTPGYARERVTLETGVSAGRVAGVIVGEPSRVADRYLEQTVYVRAGDAGRASTTSDYLDRLQALLGANGAEFALPSRLDAISAAATAATATAGGAQTSAAFVGTVDDAIGSLRQLVDDVEGIRGDAEGAVVSTVDRINTLLRGVSDLNDAVSRQTVLGRSTAGLADQRTTALQELSGLIGITAREQPNGKVLIETKSGIPLLDQRLRQLSYASGGGAMAQPIYAAIEVKFADADGTMAAATGEKIESPSVGGKLGGLLDLRDNQLAAFTTKIGTLFTGLAQTLNAASNQGSAVPPPATLTGKVTPLTGSDRLGFTGAATFAVTTADGTLAAKSRIDFSALGAGATVDDAVTAINAGLGGAATASFADGKLTITAAGSGKGVVVAGDAAAPGTRAGVGFSQFFGLNDLVRAEGATLAPSGFTGADPHGLTTGQKVQFALRDSSGRLLANASLSPTTGGSFADLVTSLNGGTLGSYGTFSLDNVGRIRFAPTSGNVGASLAVLSDTTDRGGTGLPLSAITWLGSQAGAIATAGVRRDIATNATRLPLARLQDVAVGQKALGAGDRRGATGFVDALAAAVDLGDAGALTVGRFAASTLGDAGSAASRATARTTETAASRDDAINRRDSFSGVNIDEELGQMVVLQNSYSAAARMMTTASEMFDTLLAIGR